MTDSTEKTNDAANSKTPSHIAYHVRNRERGKAIWTRIGCLWPHKDGNGFDLPLDGLSPLDGRITIRVASEKKD